MRILVLQLARFGDIFQTWPTLKALQRTHPGCELHLLVRHRFQDAAKDIPGVIVHALPTQEILRPLLEGEALEASHAELRKFLEPLCARNFDQIINLAFSPASSFLTDYLTTSRSDVRGYTRHADGHFHVPDDTSAYFYAQVGIGRSNRYHLTEIFAAVAGVDLIEDDFRFAEQTYCGPRHGVVVHLGASTADKIYPAELWVEAIREILQSKTVTLIGSAGEKALSETVAAQISNENLKNRVGETALTDLFQVVGTAEVIVGADSAPIHVASLTRTPSLNLSSASVNFWETGPLAAGSRILYHQDIKKISPSEIARHVLASGGAPPSACVLREALLSPYRLHELQFENFSWELIQALYTGTPYPRATVHNDRIAFQRLFELSELALQQIERWPRMSERTLAAKILAQVDEMLKEVARLNPNVDPAVQWFETQRLRIPPGTADETLARTKTAFQELFWVASVYRRFGTLSEVAQKAIQLCRECAPSLREYDMSAIATPFQNLLSTFHELARHSTKVASRGWPSVLDEINLTLERRDYVQLADFLEWEMVPALSSHLNQTETLNPHL